MSQGDRSLACASALVDELVAAGVRHACLSPGSRSTPIALALARHPGVELHVHLDERSSAFVAIGIAKATGKPAIVATTSGTAVAELFPAVVESSQARVPLVLLTADRPPRLRGTGANQTIVQPGIFGGYVRVTLDLPVPTTDGQEAWWRQAAREALEAMLDGPVGPVHLNCPFEEPLTPTGNVEVPRDGSLPPFEASASSEEARLTSEETERLAELVSGTRGAVVVGGLPPSLVTPLITWSGLLGWPVLAEPISNARLPDEALAAGQAVIGSSWARGQRPDVVIQLGAAPTTRATQAFVASAERLVVADRWHLDPDPDRHAWWRLAVDPQTLTEALVEHPVVQRGGIALTGRRPADEVERPWTGRIETAPDDWTAGWRAFDQLARSTLDGMLDGWEEPFEPRIARDVAAWVADGGRLLVGNSTPVRDLDLAMAPRRGLTVLANRGASGIDGLVSTAVGVAAARPHRPTVALVGDLSLVHDAGALLWNAAGDVHLTIVVVNNGGGQVFSLLPQRELPEHRRLFVTPYAVDLGALCLAAGAGHERVDRASDLVPALDRAAGAGGLRVVEVTVDPDLGLRRRAELRDTVDRALAR